jgi:hypothetical protein
VPVLAASPSVELGPAVAVRVVVNRHHRLSAPANADLKLGDEISYADAEANYGCGPTASKAHKERTIANENIEIGDGYKYRGCGLVQITFKKRYRIFSPIAGVDLVKNPEVSITMQAQGELSMGRIKRIFFRNMRKNSKPC